MGCNADCTNAAYRAQIAPPAAPLHARNEEVRWSGNQVVRKSGGQVVRKSGGQGTDQRELHCLRNNRPTMGAHCLRNNQDSAALVPLLKGVPVGRGIFRRDEGHR
jgi:hypothetical protein